MSPKVPSGVSQKEFEIKLINICTVVKYFVANLLCFNFFHERANDTKKK